MFSEFRDFIYLYGDGQIFNEYPASRRYDYSLQAQVFSQIVPSSKSWFFWPSPYPPFVAMFFGLFARLPYKEAYCLWLGISLCLYIAGIRFALATIFPRNSFKGSLILFFALANSAFLSQTLINGQLASVAVFSVGLAIYLEDRSYALYSGLALSLLLYKPTLLILIVPMLLLTRRFRALGGFSMGAAIVAAFSTAIDGPGIWLAYVRFLGLFGHVVGLTDTPEVTLAHDPSLPRLAHFPSQERFAHYVDLASISQRMGRGGSTLGMTLLIGTASAVLMMMGLLLWKSRYANRHVQLLAWATTLTWTLLLNVYVPIYDTVLAVIAITLVLGALTDFGSRAVTGWVTVLSLAIFVASWKTVEITQQFGIPVLSILLFILGSAELYLLHREIRGRQVHETSPEVFCQAIM